AFTADGKTLVIGTLFNGTQFWDVENHPNYNLKPSLAPIPYANQVIRVSLTSDGRHIATAHWSGIVHFWRLPEGPPISYSIPAKGAPLSALSPDGRYILPRGTSYMNGPLLQTRVYQAGSGEPAGPVLDPDGILLDAGFSTDGSRVVTASSTAK